MENLRQFANYFHGGLSVISPYQKRLRAIRVRSSDILFLGERIFKLKLYDFCQKNSLLYERCFGVELKPIKQKSENHGRNRNMTQPIDSLVQPLRDQGELDEDTIKQYLSERPDVDLNASGSVVRLPSMVGKDKPKLGMSRSQSELEDSKDSAEEIGDVKQGPDKKLLQEPEKHTEAKDNGKGQNEINIDIVHTLIVLYFFSLHF